MPGLKTRPTSPSAMQFLALHADAAATAETLGVRLGDGEAEAEHGDGEREDEVFHSLRISVVSTCSPGAGRRPLRSG